MASGHLRETETVLFAVMLWAEEIQSLVASLIDGLSWGLLAATLLSLMSGVFDFLRQVCSLLLFQQVKSFL